MPRTLLLLLGLWLAPAVLHAAPPSRPIDPGTLATLFYGREGLDRQWVLQGTPLPPLPFSELLAYLRRHPEKNSFPNVAYLLVDSPKDELEKGRILWVAFDYADYPAPHFAGEVILDPAGQPTYVILTRSLRGEVRIRVYRISPTEKVLPYPFQFDPKTYEASTENLPLSESVQQLEGFNPCGVIRIDGHMEGNRLLITGHREDAECPDAVFALDLKTLTWTATTAAPDGAKPRPAQAR